MPYLISNLKRVISHVRSKNEHKVSKIFQTIQGNKIGVVPSTNNPNNNQLVYIKATSVFLSLMTTWTKCYIKD